MITQVFSLKYLFMRIRATLYKQAKITGNITCVFKAIPGIDSSMLCQVPANAYSPGNAPPH